ncbi:hypothetical protein JCM30471_15040 [Desulfuromonas carbonis]|uniref:hypothetical protein n=1 Tax=Desulfuromonas sp. DDH964 TaxID=1823759 RepID=UPI00078C8EE2|nr:hypothetical protein [Desulfuromonas sp. DDH964]AMV73090.1 hypothetical protein DBW_2780 [Desulfuromonas sp. DDH964]
MQALQIMDSIYWSDRWSAEIGRRLAVADSSEGLFIFPKELSRRQILEVLQEVPADLYRLFELEPAAEADCQVMADSGACYRRLN